MAARIFGAAIVLFCSASPALPQLKPKPPEPPAERTVDPKAVPPDLADWTPRPATGPATAWEKATDKDWVDPRFRLMDTGPFLNATFRYPLGKKQEVVFKGTAIRLGEKGDAGVLFDRNSLRLAAGWTGGYLKHGDRRFGLLNTPVPGGDLLLATAPVPGWADASGKWNTPAGGPTSPFGRQWARYQGLYLHGDHSVLAYTVNGTGVFDLVRIEGAQPPILVRTLEVAPHRSPLVLHLADSPKGFAFGGVGPNGVINGTWSETRTHRLDIACLGDRGSFLTSARSGLGYSLSVEFRPSDKPRQFEILTSLTPERLADEDRLEKFARSRQLPRSIRHLTQPGPPRWGKPLVTKFIPGDESGPFAVDTLTIPHDNPFKALFFCTGLDFLPDHRIAVSTAHGDVWLVTLDEKKRECAWQRFATGLYQPMGLKVVDGKVVVLERGQLTRLHDNNSDGEADFYENVNNDWHCAGGEHSYDTCLETDPEGNFYFFKTGDTQTPHGGCLMMVSKDGGKCEVVATGFRHPIGLGISPTGIITGADQEGNWMPATRIDQYKPGGFYGDMRAHHRKVAPELYDGPLCWVPREVDNSAGGQVWVPEGTFGPLAGLPLHLSYGRCKAFVLLRDEYDGGVQGGVWDLGLKFLSGVCRGRFHSDGSLYVCGLNGWQTAAQADGCLQRVRRTNKPLDVPVKMKVVPDGIELTFSRELDRKTAEDPANYRAAWWNYRWSGDYGSKRYKVSAPKEEGQDNVGIIGAKLLEDGKTVRIRVAGGTRPVMQMQLGVNLKSSQGSPVVGSVFLTVHDARK